MNKNQCTWDVRSADLGSGDSVQSWFANIPLWTVRHGVAFSVLLSCQDAQNPELKQPWHHRTSVSCGSTETDGSSVNRSRRKVRVRPTDQKGDKTPRLNIKTADSKCFHTDLPGKKYSEEVDLSEFSPTERNVGPMKSQGFGATTPEFVWQTKSEHEIKSQVTGLHGVHTNVLLLLDFLFSQKPTFVRGFPEPSSWSLRTYRIISRLEDEQRFLIPGEVTLTGRRWLMNPGGKQYDPELARYCKQIVS